MPAHPLGVVGIIGSDHSHPLYLPGEPQEGGTGTQDAQEADVKHQPHMLHLEVRNESISGKTLLQIKDFLGRPFVCSRIRHEGHVSIPNHETIFHVRRPALHRMFRRRCRSGNRLYRKRNTRRLGKAGHSDVSSVSSSPNPKSMARNSGGLHFRSMYGVNVTRINRSVWTCLPLLSGTSGR